MSSNIDRAVRTNADTESLMSAGVSRDKWQALIDRTLARWLEDPSVLADDGIDSPTGTIIRLALDYAENLRDSGYTPADNIVPDPNGGIIFRRRCGNVQEVIHVWDDGTVEYQIFSGSQLVRRYPV